MIPRFFTRQTKQEAKNLSIYDKKLLKTECFRKML